MPTFEVVSLVVLGALAWLWFDSLKARDIGMQSVRAACQSEQLQLLDETVSIASLRPVRNDDGQVVLRRVYAFEFSDTGDNRRNGSVVLHGHRVVVVNIGLRLVSAARTLH
ncbi:MAG: DUF3301 domain-containing protein [Rhodocyclaceae bacterium]|nr:DUF3301 domain-containing protein [Rhodocyclaceae bacterium]